MSERYFWLVENDVEEFDIYNARKERALRSTKKRIRKSTKSNRVAYQ